MKKSLKIVLGVVLLIGAVITIIASSQSKYPISINKSDTNITKLLVDYKDSLIITSDYVYYYSIFDEDSDVEFVHKQLHNKADGLVNLAVKVSPNYRKSRNETITLWVNDDTNLETKTYILDSIVLTHVEVTRERNW